MNKNGWGLRVELLFIILFLVCILISTIGLQRLGLLKDKEGSYVNLGGNGENYDYSGLEQKIVNAAIKYYDKKYPDGHNDTVIVSFDTLYHDGDITKLYDEIGKECNGYAKILKNKVTIGYVKCPKYMTSGYDEDND